MRQVGQKGGGDSNSPSTRQCILCEKSSGFTKQGSMSSQQEHMAKPATQPCLWSII